MSPRLRSFLTQAGSFLLAGVLLYLALRGVDFAAIGEALRKANYWWLIPLVIVVLLSHLIRAWRWQILLKALPEENPESTSRPVSIKIAFFSVMIGYMVNYAAPRLGEVARSANLASQGKRKFTSVFGTVVVERILDVVVLGLALLSIGFLLADKMETINTLFFAPLIEQAGKIPALALLVLGVLISIAVLFIFRQAMIFDSAVQRLWSNRVQPIFSSFKDGLLTLLRAQQRLLLLLTTILIWLCYLLMAYIPLVMLGISRAYDLSMLDAWGIMILGAVGVVIPSPGGTGSYHYITIQTMQHLYQVAQAPAATYAVLTHAAQLILYTFVGFTCLILQGSSLSSLKATARAAQNEKQESQEVIDDTPTKVEGRTLL